MRAILRKIPKTLRWAIALAVLMQFLEFWGWLAGPEGKILDFFLLKVHVRAKRTTPNIVVLEIDDKAFGECFGSSSPLGPQSIKKLVHASLTADAAVIGVDIITDSEKDSLLKEKFKGQQSRIVWAAGAAKPRLEKSESFWDWFTGPQPITVEPTPVLGNQQPQEGSIQWGLPIYPYDEDLHLRRFPRRIVVPPGRSVLNWASKIAKLYCGGHGCDFDDNAEELFVSSYAARNPPYRVSDLFNCSSGKIDGPKTTAPHSADSKDWGPDFAKFKDAIVLIGGAFQSSRDFYNTPDGNAEPGIEMNASAVQAEIMGTVISEVPPWFRFLLDVGVGWLLGWVLETPRISWRSLNSRITIGFGGILGALCLSAGTLFILGYVWLSVIGIAIGMVLHLLVGIWQGHFQLGHEERLEIREERTLKITTKHVQPPEDDS